MPEMEFSVNVKDSGTPMLMASTSARVNIKIKDINDVSPRFTQQDYNATVLTPTFV